MLRIAALSSVWLAAVLADGFVNAQEAASERRPARVQLVKPREQAESRAKTGADWRVDPPQRVADRAREAIRGRAPIRESGPATGLAAFGARGPFRYSADGEHLVAAVRDGDGLALWETANHRRLRRLENSDRAYGLIAISDDVQWMAAVRRDNPEQVDLWRGDNGRHVRVIRAAGGDKSGLEFESDNRLSIRTNDGDTLVVSVPSGVAIGGLGSLKSGGGGMTPNAKRSARELGSGGSSKGARTTISAPKSARPRSASPGSANPEIADPRSAMPAAPSAPSAAPPPLPSSSSDRAAPPVGQGAPRPERIAEPRIPATISPRVAAQPPSMSSPPAMAAPSMAAPSMAAPRAEAPSDPSFDSPAPELPTFAAPATPAPPPPPISYPASAAPSSAAPDSAAREEPADDEPARDVQSELDEASEATRSPGSSPSDPGGGAAPEAAADESAEEMSTEEMTSEDASPDEASSDETSSDDASSDSAATEEAPSEEAEIAPGAAAPAGPARQFRFEMPGEPVGDVAENPSTDSSPAAAPPAPSLAAPAVDAPAVDAPRPASINIHYATNRNRLAPKDREWQVYFRGFFSSLPAFVIYGLVMMALLVFPWVGKRAWAAPTVLLGALALCGMGLFEAYVRSQLRNELSGEMYGCRPTDLAYGACEISVPPASNRRAGDLSRPISVWVFEAPENPDKHFMLRHVTEHADKEAFYKSLSAKIAGSEPRAALLFIHGYNVSFEDAIFRTAQLAVDLKFPGAAIAFCWPSYADVVKYTFDEQNAEVSIPALREVLEDLATRSGAKRVHIIAHSMGNRVLAGALRNMDPATQDRNKQVFRELVLAAPDIDSRVFQTQVLPHIVRNTEHCTLYASSRDRALLMSRCFHNYQRLGETQPELVVATGLDTIDASMVDTSLLGHSYIGDVQSIVSDLHDLVVSGKRPTERIGLVQSVRNALKYWSIKPEEQTASDGALRR